MKKINFKNLINKKENIAIIALAIVFCAGMIVTVSKNNNIPKHDGDVLVDSHNAVTEDDVNSDVAYNFEEKKAEIELKRNEIIEKIDETINQTNNEKEKEDMVKKKAQIIDNMKKEVDIEALIETKKLPKTFVLITDQNITSTVD